MKLLVITPMDKVNYSRNYSIVTHNIFYVWVIQILDNDQGSCICTIPGPGLPRYFFLFYSGF